MRTDRNPLSLFWCALLVFIGCVNVFPILWMLSSACKLPNELFTNGIHLFPAKPTVENFRIALFDYDFLRWFANSVVTTLGIALGQVGISLLAAFALSYYHMRYNALVFAFLLSTMVIPFQVTMIPNYILISRLNLLDSLMAVVLPNLANASTFFFLRQHTRGIPTALYEAASVEGADSWWSFRHVALPLCKSSISALFILCVIDGWNQYFWPLLVLSSTSKRTVTIGLQQFLDHEAGNRWGPFMATATLASVPVIIVYCFVQKYIIEAFVSSGIKG